MDINGFSDFMLLEKIEQREFKKVFADDTIRIGIEFECYIDDLAQGFDKERVDAAKAFDRLKREVNEYELQVAQESKAWNAEMNGNILGFIKNNKEKIKFINANPDRYDSQEEADERIVELEDEIEEAEDLEPYQLEDTDLDIEYYDEYESTSSVGLPYIPDELEDYVNNTIGVGGNGTFESEVQQIIWQTAFEGSDFENQMQEMGWAIYDDEYAGESGGSTTLNDIEEWDWDSNFPFSNYITGDYHDSSSFHQWRIELDPSTGNNGVEIISPIMKLQDAIPVMKKMFKFIDDFGGTTSEHGMHVNISKKGAGTDNVDLLKLMLFVDEGFVWKKFPDRVGNYYAGSVLDDIIAIVRNDRGGISKDVEASRKAEKLHAASNIIFPAFKAKLNLPKEKYKGVNFSHLHAGDGRIEMRYLGGKDYHKKFKDNVSAIGRYVYYLLLSLDENFKKKEYIKKLLRLSSKYTNAPPTKIDKREYDRVINTGKTIGTVNKGKSFSSYILLGKFVYEVSDGKIVNRHSLVKWRGIKPKIKDLVTA